MGKEERFLKGTGKTIEDWHTLLETEGGGVNEMSHPQIARAAQAHGASAWWAQGISVEIERRIGRREVGETSANTISVSASKTMAGKWPTTFEDLVSFLAAHRADLPGELAGEPTTSATEKWRYWKARMTDGSKVSINCSDASAGEVRKVRFAVEHDSLGNLDLREPVKQQWREILKRFSEQPTGE